MMFKKLEERKMMNKLWQGLKYFFITLLQLFRLMPPDDDPCTPPCEPCDCEPCEPCPPCPPCPPCEPEFGPLGTKLTTSGTWLGEWESGLKGHPQFHNNQTWEVEDFNPVNFGGWEEIDDRILLTHNVIDKIRDLGYYTWISEEANGTIKMTAYNHISEVINKGTLVPLSSFIPEEVSDNWFIKPPEQFEDIIINVYFVKWNTGDFGHMLFEENNTWRSIDTGHFGSWYGTIDSIVLIHNGIINMRPDGYYSYITDEGLERGWVIRHYRHDSTLANEGIITNLKEFVDVRET